MQKPNQPKKPQPKPKPTKQENPKETEHYLTFD